MALNHSFWLANCSSLMLYSKVLWNASLLSSLLARPAGMCVTDQPSAAGEWRTPPTTENVLVCDAPKHININSMNWTHYRSLSKKKKSQVQCRRIKLFEQVLLLKWINHPVQQLIGRNCNRLQQIWFIEDTEIICQLSSWVNLQIEVINQASALFNNLYDE